MSTRTWLACAGVLWATGDARAETVSLQRALQRAESHPHLAAAAAAIDAARGARRSASTYAHNPELAASAGPRFGGERTIDVEVALTQTVELGGERGARSAISGAAVSRARSTARRARQVVMWGVRAAHARALIARDRVRAMLESERTAAQLAELARARLEAGSGDRLSVNQALAAIGRARRQRLLAEQAYEQACFALSSAVGVAGDVELEPGGPLAPRPPPGAALAALIDRARADRSDLAAIRLAADEARAGVALARALAFPDLTVGVGFAREKRANIGLVTVEIPLPLWNRNRGGRDAARAEARRHRALARGAAAHLEREVRAAHGGWLKARAAVAAFDAQARGTLRENLALTREAFEEGKISLVELGLLQRQFVDVELDHLDALVAEIDAYHALMLAIGADGGPR